MMESQQDKRDATNYHTMRHIERVRNLLNALVFDLLKRGEDHDQSKLKEEEVDVFVEFTPKLKNSTYGSEEYKGFLKDMEPALKHHYANNRHHPEHFEDGLEGMNLLDLIEMFIDWKAAGERHANGSIYKSIELNKERFGMSDQLVTIFNNTADYMFPRNARLGSTLDDFLKEEGIYDEVNESAKKRVQDMELQDVLEEGNKIKEKLSKLGYSVSIEPHEE